MDNGISELLKMSDDFDIDIINEDIIELELSDTNEYVSLIYNKTTNQYSIEYLDVTEMEDYVVPIDDNFDVFEIGDLKITKDTFSKFKELVENALHE